MVFTKDCVEKPVRSCLERLGKIIGLHPWWFLAFPLILAASLGWGFWFLEDRRSDDIVMQFTPADGRAKTEKLFFETFFPQDNGTFSSLRLTTEGDYGAVIFSSGMNILSPDVLEEILRVDASVKDMSTGWGTVYGDICAKVNQRCHPNVLLDILDYDAANIGVVNLTFPVLEDFRMGQVSLEHLLGQVDMDRNAVVQGAKALRLFYYLQETNETLRDAWLNEFVLLMINVTTSFTQVWLGYLKVVLL